MFCNNGVPVSAITSPSAHVMVGDWLYQYTRRGGLLTLWCPLSGGLCSLQIRPASYHRCLQWQVPVCLSVCLSAGLQYLSKCVCISLSIYLSIYSMRLSICQSVFLSTCMSVCLHVRQSLFIYLYICSTYLSVCFHLSIHLSILSSVYLTIQSSIPTGCLSNRSLFVWLDMLPRCMCMAEWSGPLWIIPSQDLNPILRRDCLSRSLLIDVFKSDKRIGWWMNTMAGSRQKTSSRRDRLTSRSFHHLPPLILSISVARYGSQLQNAAALTLLG